jgi:hypothetical protein
MTVLTRPRRRRTRRVDHRLPDPDLGPHVYLLSRLDAHLALLSNLRRELGGARRPARPGSRLQAAAASALAAQHYATDIAHALAAVLDIHHCPADIRPPRSE